MNMIPFNPNNVTKENEAVLVNNVGRNNHQERNISDADFSSHDHHQSNFKKIKNKTKKLAIKSKNNKNQNKMNNNNKEKKTIQKKKK